MIDAKLILSFIFQNNFETKLNVTRGCFLMVSSAGSWHLKLGEWRRGTKNPRRVTHGFILKL